MEKAKLSLSLQCPDHELAIGMLNADPKAKKIGYCYECIAENDGDATNLKTIPAYLKDNASFYEKCRQRAHDAGEPPAEYTEELSNKGERLERFSKHIDEEKDKVKKNFEEIRKIATQIINEKEQDCLKLLDKQILDIEKAYRDYEKLLVMRWPQEADIQNAYPDLDMLKQRMSQIESMDQLKAFMAGIQEDSRMQDLYFMEEDGKSKLKKRLDGFTRCFNIPEGSLPKIQGRFFDANNLKSRMKILMGAFCQQEVQVENSIFSRINALSYKSSIIIDEQFVTLKDWLPKHLKFDLKLLFRSSVDGMSSEAFHQKCDGQGPTITLVKCLFDGAPSSSIIGGFSDQSWHSQGSYSSSNNAFLFSLAEQSHNSVKCPILEPQSGYAIYGNLLYGPTFGFDHDIYIDGQLKLGHVGQTSYENAIALHNGYGNKFTVEEVEVYRVY